jgi:hypothetical protein
MTSVRPFRLIVDDGSAAEKPIRTFATLPAAVSELLRLPSAQLRFAWISEKRTGERAVVHVRDGQPVTEWAEVAMGRASWE